MRPTKTEKKYATSRTLSRSWILIAFFAVIGLVGASIFAYSTSGGTLNEGPQNERRQLPDHYIYGLLLRRVVAINEKAEQIERQGSDAAALRSHLKRLTGLGDEQAHSLDSVVLRYKLEHALLDQRQKAVVQIFRSQYPNGQVPHGQRPGPPPPELHNIALERERLYLRLRDDLRVTLGDEVFGRLDASFRARIGEDRSLR